MTPSDKLREIAQTLIERVWETGNADSHECNTRFDDLRNLQNCVDNYLDDALSDLTALISEKQAEYFEFVKWIGFYSTTLYYRDIDEKWLRTRFNIDGIPTEEYDEYTTEELFEYWKTNEK